jgi:short-chain Z-isoprenyl diphosphate synthase
MILGIAYRLYERRLLAEVRRRPSPRHLGLIQDGHRRYAREVRLANLTEGYRFGRPKRRRCSVGVLS